MSNEDLFLQRAREARTAAEAEPDAALRVLWLAIADQWEALAQATRSPDHGN
jgi:hypothetical protein